MSYSILVNSSFPGTVTAETVEVRFAFSGKVVAINKKIGDQIKLGDWVAALDKKLLQTELDKELLEYEKLRADFDKDNSLQKELDLSVKNVEIAKARLDQANLICPVDGAIIDDGGLRIGLNVTPAGNTVKVIDFDSLKFEFEISQNDLEKFLSPQKVTISFFKGTKDDVEAETQIPNQGMKGKFKISVKLPISDKILPGMEGEAIF